MAINPRKTNKSRADYQKKKVKPAHKSMRGVPETSYGELKKIMSLSLTPTGIQKLKELSQELEISVSELIERFARKEVGLLQLFTPESELEEP